jgi:hypothetical protein
MIKRASGGTGKFLLSTLIVGEPRFTPADFHLGNAGCRPWIIGGLK